MRVLLVDNRPDRAEAVRSGLLAEGCDVVGVVSDVIDLVGQVRRAMADVIVCDMDMPSRDCLESMRVLHRDEPRPVVMFVDRSDTDSITRAMEAGVAAYVIEGLVPQRVKAVIDVAIARFQAHQTLLSELDQARTELRERKTVERAKGILMATRKLSEPEAHKTLRRLAMNRGRKLVDAANEIIAVSEKTD